MYADPNSIQENPLVDDYKANDVGDIEEFLAWW